MKMQKEFFKQLNNKIHQYFFLISRHEDMAHSSLQAFAHLKQKKIGEFLNQLFPKSTFTAFLASSLSTLNNVDALNPNIFATKLEGNVSNLVLYIVTVSL